MLGLIWFQTVCRGYQQITKLATGRQRITPCQTGKTYLIPYLTWEKSNGQDQTVHMQSGQGQSYAQNQPSGVAE